jgi:hypothetical protein
MSATFDLQLPFSGLCRDRLLRRSANSTTPRPKNSLLQLSRYMSALVAPASGRNAAPEGNSIS